MLGGDNMDLALAHLVESRLPASEGRLSAARFSQLTARCRAAKEQLLTDGRAGSRIPDAARRRRAADRRRPHGRAAAR
jgi:molecular chaperone DnaK (HSP70)